MSEIISSFYSPDQNPRHAYDFYPAEQTNAPLVILIHGGAWSFGSKNFFRSDDSTQGGAGNGMYRVCEYLSAQGFAVAAINYRLTDEVVFPLPLHDVKEAIRFFRENAADFGIDAQKIAVWGESAGGHLAQMIAATGDSQEHYYEGLPHESLETATSTSVVAAVAFYAPAEPHMLVQDRAASARGESYDTSMEPENKLMGGPFPGDDSELVERAWKMGEPYLLARTASTEGAHRFAPLLMVHGDADKVVPCAQSERMKAALTQRGVTSKLILAPGLDHAVPEFFREETYLKATADFLKACFDGAGQNEN